MPQVSGEVRWFLDPSQSERASQFATWLMGGAIPVGGGKKVREDVYVKDVKATELGVKSREGKKGLEVKALVDAAAGTLRVGGRVGAVQVWSKVSSLELALPKSTVVTHKKRWLRKFDTSGVDAVEVALGQGPSGEDPAGKPPDVGCNVEWTEVRVGESLEWTFGLEAFAFVEGVDHRLVLVDSLKKTIDALERSLPGQPSLEDPSWRELSYPAWLAGR